MTAKEIPEVKDIEMYFQFAFREGEKAHGEELQTQLMTIQLEKDMRSKHRACKEWKKKKKKRAD